MANEEITISELELADEVLADMVLAVDTTTDTKAVTLRQLKAWLGSSLPTGFIVPAVGKISDERFTLLDGKTLARTGTYEAFCNKVIEKVQAGDWQSCTEAQYNQDLADFGQCWKFVITSDYVRIPTFGHELYSEVLSGQLSCKGNGQNIGLTNRTITLGMGLGYSSTSGQNLTTYNLGNAGDTGTYTPSMTQNQLIGLATDPTKSGIVADVENIKGNVKVYYYMVVSTEGQQEEIEVDINEVYEDLNLKANTDLSNIANVASTAKSYLSGLPMPSDRYDNLTLGASGSTYTAPANGWFAFNKATNAGSQYIALYKLKPDRITVSSNDDIEYAVDISYPVSGGGLSLTIPVKNGDKVFVAYNAGGALGFFRFIYAEGEENV